MKVACPQPDTYFFYKHELPTVQSDGKFMDVDHLLMAVSRDGKDVYKVGNFPLNVYFARAGGASGSLGSEEQKKGQARKTFQ